MIVLCADQEWYGGLVKASSLAIPFLDRVQGALAGEVEHEEDGHGVVADKGKHVDELALASKIPDGEGDLGVPDGDGLLHEVDALDSQQWVVGHDARATHLRFGCSPRPSCLRRT